MLLHFVKPDEDDEDNKTMKPSQIQDALVEFFKEDYEDVESFVELKNTSQELKFPDYVAAIRRCVVDVLTQKCGMDAHQFKSRDDDEVFCKIRCDDELLLQQAFRMKYVISHRIETHEDFMEIPPYAAYDIHAPHEFAPLKNIDRIRLMDHIIKAHVIVNSLIKHEIAIDYFPLHEEEEVADLKKEMLGIPSPYISYSVDKIRDYFGERTMFYFLWMKFYTDSLLIPSVFGVFLYSLAYFGPNTPAYDTFEIIFAFVLAFWGAWFNIAWSRKQHYAMIRYGTTTCHDTDEIRPDFEGTMRKNPITGRPELHFSEETRAIRQAVSFFTMTVLMGGIVATVVAIFVYRAILMFASENADESWGPFICATLSTVQVRVFNYIYEWIALKLTDWENYKTQSEYEDALILKVFVYQAIDNFIPLIYIAFFQDMYEGCDEGDCMGELNYQLWVTLGWNMLLNVYELGVPIWMKKREFAEEEKKALKMMEDGKAHRVSMTYAEIQGKYETIVLTEEYLEMVINFGYISLFCVAFPLGPIVYWISHLIEIKVDSYKFLNFSKRPFPERANNIGIWESILRVLTTVSIFTNVALMVFNDAIVPANWLTFLAIEHSMLCVVAFLNGYIPTVDRQTKNIIKRHEYLSQAHANKEKPLKFTKCKPDHVVHNDDTFT